MAVPTPSAVTQAPAADLPEGSDQADASPSARDALPPDAPEPDAAPPAEPRDHPAGTEALPPVVPSLGAEAADPPGAPDAPRGFGSVEYWPARLLDSPSQPLSPIELPTPAATPEGGAQLELLVYVAADGSVDAVEVVSASPPGVLEAVALDVFGRARFEPGMKGGVAVRHYKRIAVGMSM
nr:energy transducer TonB [Crenobacter caeni]